MAAFSAEWKKMQTQSSRMQKAGKTLNGLGVTVTSIKSNLSYMGRYANVIRTLNSISADLKNQANLAQTMGNKLQEVSVTYKNTEQGLLGTSSVMPTVDKASDLPGDILSFDWKVDKLLWKGVGNFGTVGKAVAGFGEMVTGGVTYKTLLGGGGKAVSIFGDLAKNAYSEKPDYKKVLFGNWKKGGAVKTLKEWAADKPNPIAITGKTSTFSASIQKQLSDFTFENCKTVGDKIQVGTKWAGVAISGITNGISNYKEYQDGEITAQRAVAETVTETVVDLGIGMLATAGATALIGAAAPAVAVGVAAAGAVWAADAATRFFTNKYGKKERGLTECVSDAFLDGIENNYQVQVAGVLGNVFRANSLMAKWSAALS